MKSTIWAVLPIAFASSTAMAQHAYTPTHGFLPDSATAISVAAVIVRGVLGAEAAKMPTSLQAALVDSIWQVRSTHGRVVILELNQRDASVVRMRLVDVGGLASEHQPREGFIADSATASAIAERILGVVYGREQISRQLPFVVNQSEGVWIISGQRPRGTVGGVARMELRRQDAAVLRVTHSR